MKELMAFGKIYSMRLATFLSRHAEPRHAAEMSAETLSNNRNAMH